MFFSILTLLSEFFIILLCILFILFSMLFSITFPSIGNLVCFAFSVIFEMLYCIYTIMSFFFKLIYQQSRFYIL
ncbi:hypothetical protein PBCV1_a580R [Paramecium bursaria Chlorella virus 1]|uniref:Uncharacterized protein n=1 Tax=Paramecium bursaria Chlorella virus 1 TaxID=10506 RepID=O41062_PBCV1|nr:hypothetical protein PBCV1_a580R [Paramecium bursaria Chlorella virus 1]AAC97008.1 hypothetical protein [Paramecium bursaria Chlorella virus 1]